MPYAPVARWTGWESLIQHKLVEMDCVARESSSLHAADDIRLTSAIVTERLFTEEIRSISIESVIPSKTCRPSTANSNRVSRYRENYDLF